VPVPFHQRAESSREANIAYHLVPIEVWEAQKGSARYQLDPLLAVANMFYTGDTRAFTVLALDLGKVTAPVKYEDPDRIYPHIYGLMNTDAVLGQLTVARGADGSFLAFDAG
jgi:uncharacterized protein (DUF952 family)